MWKWTLVLVVVLCSACGKNGPSAHWPAAIVSYEGFSEAEQEQVKTSIRDLNTRAGKTLVSEAANLEGFPVKILKTAAPQDKPNRAGFATMTEDGCTVELSDYLFKTSMQDYIPSVVFHELGHCAGLDHNASTGTIMYATTERFSTYTEDAFTGFLHDILASIW